MDLLRKRWTAMLDVVGALGGSGPALLVAGSALLSAPIVVVLGMAAGGLVAGGCAGASAASITNASGEHVELAHVGAASNVTYSRFPIARPKRLVHGDQDRARTGGPGVARGLGLTLASASFGAAAGMGGKAAGMGGNGFGNAFGGARVGAETPLEQLLRAGDRPLANNGLCPPDMATIDDVFCVDRFEATLVEVLPNGEEQGWSPYDGVEGRVVRAVSEPHVVPQGYISGQQAQEACARSGKRLCRPNEWRKACKGPDHATYGYGTTNEPKRCNDHGRGPVTTLFGVGEGRAQQHEWTWEKMNHPALNQMAGTVAKTGDHEGCTNGYGVYDMVGNLHEWVDDARGTFQGGYYQDIHLNGDGCDYKTKAHASWYHDYSTGFRCCADPAP